MLVATSYSDLFRVSGATIMPESVGVYESGCESRQVSGWIAMTLNGNRMIEIRLVGGGKVYIELTTAAYRIFLALPRFYLYRLPINRYLQGF